MVTKAEIGTGEMKRPHSVSAGSSLRTEALEDQIYRPDKLGPDASVRTLGGLGPEGYEKRRVYAGGSRSLC